MIMGIHLKVYKRWFTKIVREDGSTCVKEFIQFTNGDVVCSECVYQYTDKPEEFDNGR